MITDLYLDRFKCFREQNFSLRPLTVLSGLNSSGKSSILQALLLLGQSAESGRLRNGELDLEGRYLAMPNGRRWVMEDENELTIKLRLDDGLHCAWTFDCDAVGIRLRARETVEYPDDRPPFGHCRYLAAERHGPRALQAAHPRMFADGGDDVGTFGEFVGDFLTKHNLDPLAIEAVRHPRSEGSGLGHQTSAWLSELSPEVRIYAQILEPIDRARTYFMYPGTAERRPEHVGFGLSYALPIVVRILASKPGDLLLIENPEAHLHPKGQRQLGRLLALAAKGGVQILVETHSDHIVNGVRLAVASPNDKVDPDTIRFLHFAYDAAADPQRSVTEVEIDARGRFNAWPDDFFDEWEKGLDALVTAQGRE